MGLGRKSIGYIYLRSVQGNVGVIWCTCDFFSKILFSKRCFFDYYNSFSIKRFIGVPCDSLHKSFSWNVEN